MKMECYEIDKTKFDFKKPIEWNIWIQFDIDLEKLKNKVNVTDFYMPEDIQDELTKLLLKHPKCKAYNPKYLYKQFGWIVLQSYPSSIKQSKLKNIINYIKYKVIL
jgi:hypothetical protein